MPGKCRTSGRGEGGFASWRPLRGGWESKKGGFEQALKKLKPPKEEGKKEARKGKKV